MKQLVATLAAATAIAASGALAPGAASTIAHGVPIVVETHRDGGDGRAFTLVDVGRAPELAADSGSALLRAIGRMQLCADRRSRRLAGTELLKGRRGSLTFRWSGQQSSRDGHWSGIAGRWTLIDATGTYAGFAGRGEFAADESLTSGRFNGLLFTAL